MIRVFGAKIALWLGQVYKITDITLRKNRNHINFIYKPAVNNSQSKDKAPR
jgi:hypothetical protein